ncbi:hypothetical protein OG866_15520 [Streptomyces sp. NBC_00663]|uniref:hypothetical protein n=1 Tax=Streptomyces sp. NBC_00663 TaxID=2975801 RepID=UPI002E32B944|nr:hypothetical protein [Streptomyces sp. NBC_00663]
MLRRRRIRIYGALGAAGLAAAAALTTAAPVSATDGDFTLYAKEVPADEEGPGDQQAPKVGDAFASADDLYQHKGGDKVGRDGAACTVVRAGDPMDIQCVGTFVLSGGQLTAQVLLTVPLDESAQPTDFVASITGGTDDYRGASGQIHFTDDGDYQRLDFDLGD